MSPPESAKTPQFWWEMLLSVPLSRDSHAYRRLKRSWFDHTWINHPFLNRESENHLTAAFFENFTVFEGIDWLRRLVDLAALRSCPAPFEQCEWGYEVLDLPTSKMADVAIHARTPVGECVILVEAKRRGGPLKKTDADPASYLELAEFVWAPHRYMIYLVDEADFEKTNRLINDPHQRSGIITWQALGCLQIELALALDCAEHIRAFIAGAIQHQYLSHGIRPSRLVAEYLASEPSRDQIHKDNPEKMRSWASSWRIK